jgi:hypothetical protein
MKIRVVVLSKTDALEALNAIQQITELMSL